MYKHCFQGSTLTNLAPFELWGEWQKLDTQSINYGIENEVPNVGIMAWIVRHGPYR
jgi:hypothetical protein